jgi:hypothetical protein
MPARGKRKMAAFRHRGNALVQNVRNDFIARFILRFRASLETSGDEVQRRRTTAGTACQWITKMQPKPCAPVFSWHPAFSVHCHAACCEAALPLLENHQPVVPKFQSVGLSRFAPTGMRVKLRTKERRNVFADADVKPMKRASRFPLSVHPQGDHASPLLAQASAASCP